jgi:SNF2 family DNA or RNA helicase
MGKKKKNKSGAQPELIYRYKTTPYAHQVKALKKLIKNGWGGALLMEPRTGKTKVLIDYAGALHLAGKVNRVLIFCPAGVMGVWEEEIPKHCAVPHRVTIWDKRARKKAKQGDSSYDLPKFGQDILDFVVVNYDAASTVTDWRKNRKTGQDAWFIKEGRRNVEVPKGTPNSYRLRSRSVGGREAFKKKMHAWQPQLIALDESHRIKSPSAKKSTLIWGLGKIADYRVIMTGTVVTKKKRIYDVYSQWQFLNDQRFKDDVGEPMNSQEFKDHFSVITKRYGYPKWLRNKNEGELHKLIHKDAYSVLREDCFDMPKLTPQIIPVHLDESAEVYDQMAEDMVARIKTGEVTEASIALVQGLRLRQIGEGIARTMPTPDHPKGHLRIIGSEKLDALADRLEDLMEAGEHVIVGASFRPGIKRIANMCEKRKWHHGFVMGGVKLSERTRIVRDFNNHEEGSVFIGNPAAASEGIDLRTAAITIWYSLPTSWVNYRQFSDRNALHPGPRFEEFLLVDGVDHLIYNTLLDDGDVGKRMITSPERLLRG